MLLTLVLTTQSAVTDPVEVHACQPTHWFSSLLCRSTKVFRLVTTPSMVQGVEYLARPHTSLCKQVG